jgi:hypothetical protein
MTVNRQELIKKLVELEDRRNGLYDKVHELEDEEEKLLDGFNDYETMMIWDEVIPLEAHNIKHGQEIEI